jgi:V/A-type H+-transporting ATPase subunit C
MANRDYGYAVGRIRILETRLLPAGFFDRLLKTDSPSDALRVMDETAYAAEGLATDYERTFEDELLRVYRFLRELTEDAPEIQVFLRRWDIHNLKLLVVTDGQGKPSNMGMIPWADLKQLVATETYTELPPEVQAVLAALPETGPARAAALDQAYYRFGLRILGKQRGILRDYWLARMDLTNLLVFLRLRKLGASLQELDRFMVDPGHIQLEAWRSQFEADQPELTILLDRTPYRNLLREGEGLLTEIPALEREIDNFLLEVIAAAKAVPLGIEPLIGYLLAKEREILNLRLVFTGKLNKLPAETIKRRLRHVYL